MPEAETPAGGGQSTGSAREREVQRQMDRADRATHRENFFSVSPLRGLDY